MHLMNSTEHIREPILRLRTVQLFNLFAAMLGASLVDKLGRKTLFIISNAGMLISKSRDVGTFQSVRTKICVLTQVSWLGR